MASKKAFRKYTWSIIIFSINLFLGSIFASWFPHDWSAGITLLDPDGYGTAGRMLYESGRYDLIEKAPLYPGFIAFVSLLSRGYNPHAIQVAQCVLAAMNCVLLYANIDADYRRKSCTDSLPESACSTPCLSGITCFVCGQRFCLLSPWLPTRCSLGCRFPHSKGRPSRTPWYADCWPGSLR